MRKTIYLAALLASVGVASAAAPMHFVGTGLGQTGISVTFTDGGGTTTYGSVFAGEMKFTYNGDSISTLCTSLRNTISTGQSWNTTVRPVVAGDGNLFLAGKIMSANIGSVDTADEWSGMQLAVWKAIYDGSNLAGSNFIVNSGASATVLSDALGYYNAGIGATGTNAKYYPLDAVTGLGQPQISAQATPEPASMAVLALGALGVLRRRRKA